MRANPQVWPIGVWNAYPIRTCRSIHECCICTLKISLGEKYFDPGYGRRAHVECAEARSQLIAGQERRIRMSNEKDIANRIDQIRGAARTIISNVSKNNIREINSILAELELYPEFAIRVVEVK